MDIQQTLEQAVQLHKAGDLRKAEDLYQRILEADPVHPIVLHLLGVTNFQEGKLDFAVQFISKSLAIKPDYAEAHNNLANALKAQGKLEEAAQSFQNALDFNPDIIEAYNNLGNTLKDLGRLDEAVDNYKKALAANPDFAEAHNNLGNAFNDLGRLEEAAASYRKALSLKPNIVEAHNNLGNVLKALGKLNESVASFKDALSIKPDYAEAHYNMGNALRKMGKLDEAVASFQNALARKPDYAEAHNNFGHALQDLGQLDEAINCYKKALSFKPDFIGAEKNLLFAMLNVPGLSPEEIFKENIKITQKHERSITCFEKKFSNTPLPDRKLRIGYLSSDFRNHPVGTNVLPLITSHNRENFEIFCYADVPRPDKITEHFQASADHWRSIEGKSDNDVAEAMRADKIDVLICLAGRFDNNRPLVCAHRAAPVQVSVYDGTTSGLREMDYWLTDDFLNPSDTKEKFTEELYRLPVLYQWPPIKEAPPVSPLPAVDAECVTFGSFNNPAKINRDVLNLWARVLTSVPGSRMLLKYKNWYSQTSLIDGVTEHLTAFGVEEDRITFSTSDDTFDKHLSRYAEVDIGLDPFPFNGATTTFQAMWMGVPVISLVGDTFISRMTGSILHHVGLGDLAVDSPEAYIATAKELAGDLLRLKAIRTDLRERVAASPLCDSVAYVRSVETAYRDMWRSWCAGQ